LLLLQKKYVIDSIVDFAVLQKQDRLWRIEEQEIKINFGIYLKTGKICM